MFVDQVEITVEAGAGGAGAATFRREKYVPRGGPSGGDGGNGGSIVLQVDLGLSTLLDFRYNRQYRAVSGENGQAKKRAGRDGSDLVLRVPPGTTATDAETGEALADLTDAGQTATIARGGMGGRGNLHFTSSVRQAPKFAELGEPGERRRVRLDLRLVADVGIIGFPSVGKSTLIAAASAARPKIADYPFTTLVPNLGIVSIGPSQSFAMADMPGLVEGAHRGVGLGARFLRHIARTRVLIHMLDVSGLTGRDPLDDLRAVNEELRLHDAALASRPQIVALNKTDVAADADEVAKVAATLEREGLPVHAIAAATHAGVERLMLAVWNMIEEARRSETDARSAGADADAASGHVIIHGPPADDGRAYSIRRDDTGTWVVEGRSLERLVIRTDMANDDAVTRLQQTLERSGVHRKLREMGARHDDTVRVGRSEFLFDDEDLER
jgi:GTP-binding protein